MRIALALVVALAVVSVAEASVRPQPGPGDPRILVASYDPNEVYEVEATLGYQLSIEFDPGERIENVAIGDALGWQVTPNRKANLLFVKPMERVPDTNMSVVTNLRVYTFALSVRPGSPRRDDPAVAFGLRFLYPELALASVAAEPPPAAPPPQDVNHAYSYQGAPTNVPTRVFDDGKATYFQFREGEDYPAVFAVEADGGESVVNTFQQSGYLAVDRVLRGWVLRGGGLTTRLYNDGFKVSEPGPLSPQPRPKPKFRLFGR